MWFLYILIHISLLLKTLFVHALVHVLRRFWIRTVYTSPKSSYPYVLNPYLEYKIVNVVFFLNYCKSSPMCKISKTKSRVFKHCTYIKLRHHYIMQ
jgi:hypothetical protein